MPICLERWEGQWLHVIARLLDCHTFEHIFKLRAHYRYEPTDLGFSRIDKLGDCWNCPRLDNGPLLHEQIGVEGIGELARAAGDIDRGWRYLQHVKPGILQPSYRPVRHLFIGQEVDDVMGPNLRLRVEH